MPPARSCWRATLASDLRVMPLGAAPRAVPALAGLMRAVWPGWYGPGGQGDAEADLRARMGGGLPLGWVALRAGAAVGTVALAETSHGARPGEGPWLIGLAVSAAQRRQGIASRLVAAVEAHARAPILTTTQTAAGLLARRGWTDLRETPDGWRVMRWPG